MKWFSAFVRTVMRDVTYHRRYLAEIERRAPNGTFDIKPLDDAMRGRGLQGVPERVGIAGAETLAVKAGTRCLFGFANGDTMRPEIVAWEFTKGSAVVSLDGGLAGLARKGDPVKVVVGATVPIVCVVSGTVTTPPPASVTTPVAGLQFVGIATLSGEIRADIIGGTPKVKA